MAVKTRKTKAKIATDESKLMVTQERFDEMQAELKERVEVLRDQIALEISTARDLGDLSENQAYADAMNRKDINEARIEELEYLISIAQVIQSEGKANAISIGSVVEVKKISDGKVRTITLVGKEETQEADPRVGKVSIDSPLGSALVGRSQGDKVVVKLPAGDAEYQITKFAA
jgi:transcription elongation factor GreA